MGCEFRFIAMAVCSIALSGCADLNVLQVDGTTPLPEYSTQREDVLDPLPLDEREAAALGCDWRLSAKWAKGAASGYEDCVDNEARIMRQKNKRVARLAAESAQRRAENQRYETAAEAGHVRVPALAIDKVLDACYLTELEYNQRGSTVNLGKYNLCIDEAVAAQSKSSDRDKATLERSRELWSTLRGCHRTQGRDAEICKIIEEVANQSDDLAAEMTSDFGLRCILRMQRYGADFVRTCVKEELRATERLETAATFKRLEVRRCMAMFEQATLAMAADCVDNGSGAAPALDEALGFTGMDQRLRLLDETTSKSAAR